MNVPNFGPGTNPARLRDWARVVEGLGYDLLMVSDHVVITPDVAEQYPAPFYEPFTTLSWLAGITSRVRLGTTVLIAPYRHPLLVARMAANLDALSGGRLVLGVGAGSDRSGEFDADRFGEEPDMKLRAKLLDDGLAKLQAFWAGEFEPRPVNGTIPIWVAARWPFKRGPLERAKRYDGVVPIDQERPEQLAELIAAVGPGKDIVVTNRAGTDPAPWAAAGATWCLTGFGAQPTYDEVARAIDAI